MPHKLVVMQNVLIAEGQKVLVSHDQGDEIGTVYSINYMSGKAVIYIEEPSCPHFYATNIFQIRPLNLRLIKKATVSDPEVLPIRDTWCES